LYTRRLDKIYENLGKSPMLPKVVSKMRQEYANNPHKFYLMVCQKYNITPEKKIDAYLLVYGRTQFEKHPEYKFHVRASEQKKSKEVVHEVKEEEPSTPEKEDEEKDEGQGEEEEEEEEEDEPEPPKKESKYKLDMSERPARQSSPRYEQRSSPRYETTRLESPRIGSPRGLYRFDKGQSVEQLDYVYVTPGDVVETMVLTGKMGKQESGFWIPAQILVIDEEKEVMDLRVLQPAKYGLAQKALGVPYRYVRKPANIVWMNE